MTARALEENGIATVIIGSAMDIVTHCRVPRYLHNDFPLGNPLGPPDDRSTQRETLLQALALLDNASEETILATEFTWPGNSNWKEVYGRVNDDNRELLLKMGEENRRKRTENKANGLAR